MPPQVQPGSDPNASSEDILVELVAEYLDHVQTTGQTDWEPFLVRAGSKRNKLEELLQMVGMVEKVKPSAPSINFSKLGQLPDRISSSLGEIVLLEEIGRGGMGIVYCGVQLGMNRPVAVKLLPHSIVGDEKRRKRFEEEARLAASLQHRCIVPVLAFGESDAVSYYVMNLIDGTSLDKVIRWLTSEKGEFRLPEKPREIPTPQSELSTQTHTQPVGEPKENQEPHLALSDEQDKQGWKILPTSWKVMAKIAIQAAHALQHAHEKGILHRDIKPANIMINREGQVFITDFGLAKAYGDDSMTNSGEVVGTMRYIAPERFRGQVDARSDLYSLGITLYELASQTQAFKLEGEESSMLDKILDGELPPLRQVQPKIPKDFEAIINRLIHVYPEHRYQSALALVADLRRFLKGKSVASSYIEPPKPSKTSTVKPEQKSPSKTRFWTGLVSGAVVATVAAFAIQAYLEPEPKTGLAQSVVGVELESRLHQLDRLLRDVLPNTYWEQAMLPTRLNTASDRQLSPIHDRDQQASRELSETLLKWYQQLALDAHQHQQDCICIEAMAVSRIAGLQAFLGQPMKAKETELKAQNLIIRCEKGYGLSLP